MNVARLLAVSLAMQLLAIVTLSDTVAAEVGSGEKHVITLDPRNTTVRFEVDSTWRVVRADIADMTGRLVFDNLEKPSAVQGRIQFPVRSFDTDNESRNKTLRRVLAANDFPEVDVEFTSVSGSCLPPQPPERSCRGTIHARLNIRDVIKEVALPYVLSAAGSGRYQIEGRYSFEWADYNVEDPSAFFSRVDKTVTVRYHSLLAWH